MLSDRGPRIAVADVNHDALDDIYVCGASGQAGQLLIQQANGQSQNGRYRRIQQICGHGRSGRPVFDANKDGYPDLYVAAGGNQYNDGNPNLADHFYLNDGKDILRNHLMAFPPENKSCISMADADNDGDIDLFIGGLADKQYGIAQPSYLLINNGTGILRPTCGYQSSKPRHGKSSAGFGRPQPGWLDGLRL